MKEYKPEVTTSGWVETVTTLTPLILVAIVIAVVIIVGLWLKRKEIKESDKVVHIVKERMYNMVVNELGVKPNKVTIAYRGNSEFTVKAEDKEYIFLFKDKFTSVDKVIEV